jgi:hypothetical protein
MSLREDPAHLAKRYAADFVEQLHLDSGTEQRCEWSCILWSKDHWADQAQKSKIELHQAKERLNPSPSSSKTSETLFANSQFMNTVAQVYSKLFNTEQKSCAVKDFPNCPFMAERQQLLNSGALATVFVTILHKATFYAMLDRHPLDSGLLDDEYRDVYRVDLTDYQDLERSLSDGRFEKLYSAVVRRAMELAGLQRKDFD